MSSLPDQFRDDDNKIVDPNAARSNQATDLFQNTQNAKNKQPFFSLALIVAMFAVVLNGVVFFAVVEKPMNKIEGLFGGKSVSTLSVLAAQQAELTQLHKSIEQHAIQLNQSAESARLLKEEASDIKRAASEHHSGLTQLEKSYQELKTDIQLLNRPRSAPKPVAIEKPKLPEKPLVVVTLVSIRIQGEMSWVSLREGGDVSPLLTVGDEWHGIKLVTADPIKKEAQLFINGVTTWVKL